jgi:2-methylisocitrate lyase-like PEP mutase family enzyme
MARQKFGAAGVTVTRASSVIQGTDSMTVVMASTCCCSAALGPAIDKLVAFANAGADCLYAPGVRDAADIAQMVKAVTPKPLNVVMMQPGLSLAELADLGVRRVSIGGAFARVMWASLVAAAKEIKRGRFDVLGSGTPGAELNQTFAPFAADYAKQAPE